MSRVIKSGDGRLLMCGKIIIQLNQDLDDIDRIGCILREKDHSINRYRFLDLLVESEREIMHSIVKNPPPLTQIIRFDFDNEPIFPQQEKDVLYFTNYIESVDNAGDGTSIIKMMTHDLKCTEIYVSKFKVIQLQVRDSNPLNPSIN